MKRMMANHPIVMAVVLACAGCGADSRPVDAGASDSPGRTEVWRGDRGSPLEELVDGGAAETAGPLQFTVMTFNIGTSSQQLHDKDEEEGNGDGYTSAHSEEVNAHYGNNLAWNPAEQAVIQFIAENKPAIVAFNETFHDPWCEEIEPMPGLHLVCDEYTEDRPLQIERLTGDDYQVATADGKPDNTIAVRRDFGSLVGCPVNGPCLNGIKGLGVPGCSDGARIGTIEVQLMDERRVAVVVAHTNAGMTLADQQCRVKQFQQMFVDRGDGKPAAYGTVNLVMGDMNTDPFLFAGADPSADEWNLHVGPGKAFHYLSSADAGGPPTHSTTIKLDHVVSDVLSGNCVVPGETEGVMPVMESSFFDHRPVLCTVEL